MFEPRASVVIKTARVSRLLSGYPWVAKEDVVEVVGKVEPGGLVAVQGQDGRSAGVASYNPQGRFALRILDRTVQPITKEWFRNRLRDARTRRRVEGTNSERVLFAEADGVPGLIVDRFDRWLIVQVRSLGMEVLKPAWLPALVEELNPAGILERSDMEGRAEEGMEPVIVTLHGSVPESIEVIESGLKFRSPTGTGLKTGFYLDQRDARRKLAARPGERVLDVCCYTGGFTLYAAHSGAQATGVDILPEAVALARENARANELAASFVEANAFEWLAASTAEFDTIILDPPAIAKVGAERDSLRSAIYKLSDLALPRLAPGGRLIAFSCSYQMGIEGLIDVVRSAAVTHRRPLLVDDITLQPTDHPYLAHFPESLYLKGVWCRAP